MANIAVFGAGGWGTALSVMCAESGHRVSLWSPFENELESIRRDGEHKKLLPGVRVPEKINLTSDAVVANGADVIVLAVPSFAVRQTAVRLKDYIRPGQVIVNVAKGFEEETLSRLSQVIAEELPQAKVVILSGPSHAEEVSRGVPTTVVAASASKEAALFIQDTFMNRSFRIYVNPDVVGVELGGALKNIIALAAGVCDGLKLGDNTKAALMTRGITEMARLGVAMGGCAQTFAGLTGIGDLIVTCTSVHSRNHRAGVFIGEGIPAERAIEKVGMTVEGYRTTRAAFQLSQKFQIEMPIVCECYRVLYESKNPRSAISDLMQRKKKHEIEEAWLSKIKWE
ncbi:MAG TPA: NAD(P)H-dependent glycerol-3-phosphate dehydrogenase [Clostridia bacterium]|nr:NAD(P)H-dependent glycerol-3-phosphate dehydrogenase [Clostridia bacterium]